VASERVGGEGLRLQSQGGQDLCVAAATEHLIFKTSTEEQTVDLTNKGMTKPSQRFSRWFHSARRVVHQDSCFDHEQVRHVLQSV